MKLKTRLDGVTIDSRKVARLFRGTIKLSQRINARHNTSWDNATSFRNLARLKNRPGSLNGGHRQP